MVTYTFHPSFEDLSWFSTSLVYVGQAIYEALRKVSQEREQPLEGAMTSFYVEAELLAWHSWGLLSSPLRSTAAPLSVKSLFKGLLWLPGRDTEAALPYTFSFHSLGCLAAELLNLPSLPTLPYTLSPNLRWWDGILHCLGSSPFSGHLQCRGSVLLDTVLFSLC